MRIFWIIIFLSSLGWAGSFIWREYQHQIKHPVITTVGSPNNPVNDFRFPALTICPGKVNLTRGKVLARNVSGSATSMNPFAFAQNILRPVVWSCNFSDQNVGQCLEKAKPARKLVRDLILKEVLSTYSDLYQESLRYNRPRLEELALGECLEESVMGVNWTRSEFKARYLNLLHSAVKENGHEDVYNALLNIFTSFYGHGKKKVEDVYRKLYIPELEKIVSTRPNVNVSIDDVDNLTLIGAHISHEFVLLRARDFGTFLKGSKRYLDGIFGQSLVFQTDFDQPLGKEAASNNFFIDLYKKIRRARAHTESGNVSLIEVAPLLSRLTRSILVKLWTTNNGEETKCSGKAFDDYFNAWYELFFGKRSDRPCLDKQESPCCQLFGKEFSDDLALSILQMRYASLQASTSVPHNAILEVMKTLDYDLPTNMDNARFYISPMIPHCRGFQSNDSYPCEGFLPTLTDSGVCFTFNGKKVSHIYNESPYVKAFNWAYEEESTASAYDEPLSHLEHGKKIILLDNNVAINKDYANHLDFKGADVGFVLSLNDNDQPFNMRLNPIAIPVGHQVKLKISPSVTQTSENLHSVSEEQRKCRFPKENEGLHFFQNYSKVIIITMSQRLSDVFKP